MYFTEQQILNWMGDIIWPFLRISALFVSIPVFSGRLVPARIKVAGSLFIAVMTIPLLPQGPTIDVFSYAGLLTALQQLLIGLLMGLALQIVFSAVIFGGQGIAYSMGLGFASMVDPVSGVTVPVVSQFYLVLTTLLFLAVGGHLVMIELLIDSFQTFPIGPEGFGSNDIWTVLAWSGRIFSSGLLMAFPAMAALMLVNMAFGVVTRAAPQLNIFAVGFPVTLVMGSLLMWLTIPSVMNDFTVLLNETLLLIQQLLGVGD